MTIVLDRVDAFIQTKLYRPEIPPGALDRQHLIDRLQAFQERPVFLVAAPAGYGKTTLVTQWLESTPTPSVWLSLDENDQVPSIFLTYLLAGVTQLYPEVGEATSALLRSPQAYTLDTLANSLISDLEELPENLIVVLDDFHLIDGFDAGNIIERVLRLMPPSLTLVLLCRSLPHLPLVSLRLRRQLGELTEADLRLTEDEAATLLTQVAGRDVSAETAIALDHYTEGWITGLYLAGLSLRRRSDPEVMNRLGAEGNVLVVDYLVEEVLDQLPPEMVEFFLRTSILDSFDSSLCDVLLTQTIGDMTRQPQPARLVLEAIREANLFLIPLDDDRRWYRYHHLFRTYWRRRFDAEFAAEDRIALHRLAADWLEASGQISQAMRHALATGDPAAAAEIAERHYFEAVNAENWSRVDTWLALLPNKVIDRPGVLMMRAWIEHFGWRLESAARLAQRAVENLSRQEGTVEPEIVSLRHAEAQLLQAQYMHFSGDKRSLALAEAALEQLPPESLFVRSLAELYVVLGYQHLGRTGDALAYLEEHLAQSSTSPFSRTSRLMLALCGVYLYGGDLTAAQSAAHTYQQMGEAANSPLAVGWAKMILGIVAYERNDLTLAEELFREIISIRDAVNGKTAAEAYTGLFLTYLNSGRLDDAQEILERFRTRISQTRTLVLKPIVDSLQARLTLARRQTQPGASLRLAPNEPPRTIMPKLGFMDIPHVTSARLLLEDGTPEALRQARQLLLDVRAAVEACHESRLLVEIDTVLALVAAAQGEEASALEALRCALVQGEPQGYVRSIVDVGQRVAPLLRRLREGGEFVAYITKLEAALQDPSVVGGAALEVLLTNREMEVLERLMLRRSNKEIAAELYLSPLTVKRHTQSLFRKLGASNRREAVVLARQKGLSITPAGMLPTR